MMLAGLLADVLRKHDKLEGREMRAGGSLHQGRAAKRARPVDDEDAYVQAARKLLQDEREERDIPEGALLLSWPVPRPLTTYLPSSDYPSNVRPLYPCSALEFR